MDYTINLKKILSEKQFAYLQSIYSSAKAVMSPQLFSHCVGTFNYCFIMADRFLLNGAAIRHKSHANSSGSTNAIGGTSASGSTRTSTSGGANTCGSTRTSTSSSTSSFEKSIPVRCFNLAVAAILHDYGKIFCFEELKAIAVKEKLKISDFELNCGPILHSFAAPFLLERDFKIKDRDILNSVRMHTTGSVKMSTTDKILYISDKIEQTRDYEGVEKFRHLSFEDINLCLLEVYKSNIIYVLKGNNVLHPETAKIWNYIHGGLKNVT